ncbi:MAG: hypothetical protein ACE37K_13650 [Planctomycetota bacterium]
MSKRFLILGMQRTGTTFVAACAGGHPQASMLGPELRQGFFGVGMQDFVAGQGTFANVRETFPRLFDALTGADQRPDTRIQGAKTAIVTHEEAVVICDCLEQFFPDILVVLVTRADLVASCGSQLRARRSGVWHSWSGRSPTGTLRIPPRTFRRYVREARLIERRFRALAATHRMLELSYEQDVCGGRAHEQLFAFLGLDVVEPSWVGIQKLNPDANRYIRNHDRLQQLLRRCPVVDPAEEQAAAQAVRARLATDQSTAYLLGRAADLAASGHLERGVRDLQLALQRRDAAPQTFLMAKVHAAFEHPDAAAHPDTQPLLAHIEAGCGDNPTFLLQRAGERERAGRLDDARQDLTAALLGDPDRLGERGARTGLEALGRVLRALDDAELAARAARELAARHREHPAFAGLPGADAI